MNTSSLNSQSLTSDSSLIKRNSPVKISSQDHDTKNWTLAPETRQVSSLAFLPILGLIIFAVCSFLKVYKWSRDNARWKARGDVEFGDEADVNYGIITVGDKDFCQIDIRSDGASVYDTINSFRLLGNGYAAQFTESYAYYDTVSSYKSLLMQKADGSQYDSVKSYKAFLQKVTQNKDLAVEVKLLQNYPVRSKSAEHCVLAEEASERPKATSSRMHGTLPLIEQLHKDGQVHQLGKRRPKQRRASGDAQTTKRKRSLQNPRSRRITCPACSLPSIRNTISLSGDSEEGLHRSFKVTRKKSGTKRNQIPHSVSGGKLFTIPDSAVQPAPRVHSGTGSEKRCRHFSVDSVQHLKRGAGTMRKNGSSCINNEADVNESCKIATEIDTVTKTEPPFNVRTEGSSSDNANSSHSSDTDVPSDILASGSDTDTKRNDTLPDGQTLDNDVFVSFDSVEELPFSSEILRSSLKRPLSETKILLAHAREEFFKNKLNNAFSLMSSDLAESCPSAIFVSDHSSSLKRDQIVPIVQISSHENHFQSINERTNLDNCPTEAPIGTPSGRTCEMPTSNQQVPDIVMEASVETASSDIRKSHNKCSPRKLQHFHITAVL